MACMLTQPHCTVSYVIPLFVVRVWDKLITVLSVYQVTISILIYQSALRLVQLEPMLTLSIYSAEHVDFHALFVLLVIVYSVIQYTNYTVGTVIQIAQ